MWQALVRKGSINAENIPAPNVSKGYILIRVVNSCISAGTETAGVASSGKSVIRNILEQPEKIKIIFDSIKSVGLSRLFDQYNYLKNSGNPTGYSVSGIVVGIGQDITEFRIGDKVAAAGGGYAFHAEFVQVPKNLVVKMDSEIDFPEASTVALGAISLHAVRRAGLQVGEICVVIGTGILGLLAIQILRISGVRIIAIDINDERLKMALDLGASISINSVDEDPVQAVENFTKGKFADTILFCASTNESSTLSKAFNMCKRKGKVVLLGTSGLELNRKDIYEKEIDLMISTSYGPGRYDNQYEEYGNDYPYAYVRWTEARNFKEYLRLIATGDIVIRKLISKVYSITNVHDAFELIKSKEKPLIVLLDYGLPKNIFELDIEKKVFINQKIQTKKDVFNVGIIGIGNFALSVHLPNLKKLNRQFCIYALASNSGTKAKNAGEYYKTKYVTTQYDDIINDPEIDVVMICTRHGNHAKLALKALKSGKHTFVEKPLATNLDDLKELEDFFSSNTGKLPLLMVGYNRRYSPYIKEINKITDRRIGPLFIHYRMNAGYLPTNHWTHSDGGRIIGEACHIVDLMSSLTNSKIISVNDTPIYSEKGKFQPNDNKTITIKYKDGSIAVIDYFSMGNKQLPKEYMEIHFDEKSVILDNYRSLKAYGTRINNIQSKSKGHIEELQHLYDSLKSNEIVNLETIFDTSRLLLNI